MKEVPERFTSMGDTFVRRHEDKENDVAIYERSNGDYEVVIYSTAKNDHTFPNGSVVNKGDKSYPSTNSWGNKGWTCTRYERALEKFDEVVTTVIKNKQVTNKK